MFATYSIKTISINCIKQPHKIKSHANCIMPTTPGILVMYTEYNISFALSLEYYSNICNMVILCFFFFNEINNYL